MLVEDLVRWVCFVVGGGVVPYDFSLAISVALWLWVVCELLIAAALVKHSYGFEKKQPTFTPDKVHNKIPNQGLWSING